MCRSLFCKPLEHTDRFPSSGSLLSNSVFGPTLVLSNSPSFLETLAGRLHGWSLWASFVRRVFTGQSHQSSRGDTQAQVQWQQWQVLPWLPRLPPPLQFCLPHLWLLSGSMAAVSLPMRYNWHCQAGGGWQRTKLWLIQLLGETFGPWVDTETSYEARKRNSLEATQTWKPQIYIQTFPPFSFSEFGTFASERETGKKWISKREGVG